MEHYYDLIIIGAGPSGINCGIEASKKGLKYCILEQGVLVNSLFNFPTNMTFFSTSVKLEIGDIPFISHTEKPTRKEALEYYRRITETYNLNIHYNTRVNEMIAAKSETYIIHTSRDSYHSSNVVVATGFYGKPRMLNVPGEDLSKVKHYYDEAHPYIGRNILVVGAANSACDVALETWQKGANVTMLVRGSELNERVKYWILPNIQNRIEEGSIPCYYNSKLVKISEREVILDTPEGQVTLPNDYVLAMTGYTPDYELLHKLKVSIGEDEYMTPIYNEETLESSLPNVYLSGVVNGGLKTNRFFIENTREQAKSIVSRITSMQQANINSTM